MNILFKKENLKSTVLTIANIFLGVLFCVLQVEMYNFAESVLCMFLLAVGIICISIYALMPREDKILKLLVFGILATAFGLLMMKWPIFFGMVLSVIAGLGGLLMFIDSIKDKKKGVKPWITDFVIGLIVMVMSFTTIILSGTSVAKIILSIFFGVIFLTQGIYGLVQLVALTKSEKNNKTIFKDVKENNDVNEENKG